MIGIFFVLLVAYIMGSFPMGYWIGQVFFKKDITLAGSGNIGATNAYRTLGPRGGAVVLLADFLKGAAPVIIMKSVKAPAELVPWLVVAAGLLAITGHTFSIFLKFKGGKGAATAVGVITILFPKVVIAIIAVWLVVLGLTRYISVSSMIAAALLPILVILLHGQEMPLVIFSFLVSILIIYKHRSNVKRLIDRTEPKVGKQVG